MQNQQQTQRNSNSLRNGVPSYLLQYYDITGKVGEGTYGVVYLGRSLKNRAQVLAVKTFKPGKESDGISPTAIREIMLLKEIRHVNIVRLDSVHLNRQDPCLSLAFDYAEYDLYEIVRFHRERLRGAPMVMYTLKSIMMQLLNGLSFMEQHWIMHRDLKPSNILIMGDGPEQGCVKLADFGLARIVREPLRPLYENGVVVTIWYRAPELLLGMKHYTSSVDTWAAGCILGELLMLKPLFHGEEQKQPPNAFQGDQLDKIFRILGHPTPKQFGATLEHAQHWHNNTDNVRMRKPEHSACLSEHVLQNCNVPGVTPGCAVLDLLDKLLTYNPAARITAQQALRHPFFSEEPLPGPNAFRHNGRTVVNYPSRMHFYPSR